MISNLHNFQQWRHNRGNQLDALANRFLFPQQQQQQQQQETDPLGPLPEGWGTTNKQWPCFLLVVQHVVIHVAPANGLISVAFVLFLEKRMDDHGRVYFVNHKNRATQWEDPRTQG